MDTYINYLLDSAEMGRLDYVIIGVVNGATTRNIGDSLVGASINGYLEVVKYLVEQGVDIHHISYDNGDTAIQGARENGYPEIVEYLISQGADPK